MNKIEQCRAESVKIRRSINGRNAVIVITNDHYGVQFWTADMIGFGSSMNTDGTKSIFVTLL